MNELQTFWNGLDWSVLTDILISVIPALLCITLHELAHGFVAWRLGDSTAKNAGRLTLNPLRHMDDLGRMMMVGFKVGWAKPVPVNMRNFRNPKTGMAICAAAGPLCNLLLGALLLFLYGLLFSPLSDGGTAAQLVLDMALQAAYLSLALAVFNVIPIPPLDGSKVLFSFLSDRMYAKLMRYERWGMLLLLALVALGLTRAPLAAATLWLFDHLFVLAEAGFRLTQAMFY